MKFPAEVMNKEEVERFMASFSPTATGVRNRAACAVMLYGQLRCAEMCDLRLVDVSMEGGAITVLCGKGGKRRVVGMSCALLERYVRPWLDIRPPVGNLFCTGSGRRFATTYVRRMVRSHAALAGIEHRVAPHCLRHTGACMLADMGVDIRIISRQLGHSNLAITDRYLNHLNPREVIQAVGAVDWD